MTFSIYLPLYVLISLSFSSCTGTLAPKEDEGFVLFSDTNRLGLAETSVAAVIRFSKHPVTFFCVECDTLTIPWLTKYPPNRVKTKRLPASPLGIYFSKWDAILASDYERGILIESDTLITPEIRNLWKALRVLKTVKTPMIIRHPDHNKTALVREWRKRGHRPSTHYGHAHITWTSRSSLDFLRSTYDSIIRGGLLSGLPTADEGAINVALWLNGSTAQWCLLDPYFEYFLRNSSYTQHPNWTIAWMMIHGNKDIALAWHLIESIANHEHQNKGWWSIGDKLQNKPPLPTHTSCIMPHAATLKDWHRMKDKIEYKKRFKQHAKIWVSMSLCLDSAAKKVLPSYYNEAAVWATKLWTHFKQRVIVTVVTKNNTWENSEVVRNLRENGAIVVHRTPMEKYGCITTSQLARMWAFENDMVDQKDIIMLADVDAFPRSDNIFKPLITNPDVKAWIWQYTYSTQTGFTFPMSFIALRTLELKNILGQYGPSNVLLQLMNYNKLEQHQLVEDIWGLDQRIITNALLNNKLCSIRNSNVWTRVKLKPQPFNDDSSCWHGTDETRHGAFKSWLHMSPNSRINEIATNILESVKL